MGRAVVALPTGGIPEFVREGSTGWLAHGREAAALARAMRDAVEDGAERARRGDAASALVAARYSVDAMRTGYDLVYRAIAP
jgi:glycosyltransferase involved in cell wall biosynthesis